MAGYIVRNPVSLKRLVYIDGHKAVIYRALKPNYIPVEDEGRETPVPAVQ